MKKETETQAVEVLQPQEIVEPVDETKIEKTVAVVDTWKPITEVGRKVKTGEITDINVIFDKGLQIKESQIVDALMSNMESDLLAIGQSKGKFGGGKRKAFRQTQKKTNEGNKPKFATYAVIGNRNGYVGLGYGKTKETVPAREKAFKNAKMNLFKVVRGCGSWECNCKTPHSIPYKVHAKCGSVKIALIPAPKGTGLCIEKECAKILHLAGIKDVWSKIIGQSNTKMNTIKACEMALKSLITTRVMQETKEKLSVWQGSSATKTAEAAE